MNERILIVDDEPSIHEVARAYLEHEGFIVYHARDGREGLDLALSKRPALIVLGWRPCRDAALQPPLPRRTRGRRLLRWQRIAHRHRRGG